MSECIKCLKDEICLNNMVIVDLRKQIGGLERQLEIANKVPCSMEEYDKLQTDLKVIREAVSEKNILSAIICAIPILCKKYVIKLGTFAMQDLAETISKAVLSKGGECGRTDKN